MALVALTGAVLLLACVNLANLPPGFRRPYAVTQLSGRRRSLSPIRGRRHVCLHHDENKNLRGCSQFHTIETWLRDSDSRHRVTVERDGSPDDLAVTVEVAPPEAVAEYYDRPAVGNGVVVRSNGAATAFGQHQGVWEVDRCFIR
jgi:hypothetical protein